MFTFSAPGSAMLLGEHAVLYGYHALICALNQRIRVSLKVREDNKILIYSELGEYSTTIEDIKVTRPFTFLLQTLKIYEKEYPSGFTIRVASDLSHKMGLGSSAAIVAATLGCINEFMGKSNNLKDLYAQGIEIIQLIQSKASGADLAASLMGGLILYRITKDNNLCPFIKKIKKKLQITLIYSGYKKSTAEVIEFVAQRRKRFLSIIDAIFKLEDQCVLEGIKAIVTSDWLRLGEIFKIHQNLQSSLGVSNIDLDNLINRAMLHPEVKGAKISGSGLGDSIVLLGKIPIDFIEAWHAKPENSKVIEVVIDDQGLLKEN